MQGTLEQMQTALGAALGSRLRSVSVDHGQLIVDVGADDLVGTMTALRDDPGLGFSMMIDLAGVDYRGFADGWDGPRYAVVYHLLSLVRNWRVRVRVFCTDEDFPALDSLIGVWPVVNWYEREAFDLYGIVFRGHPDLRRILTDYGFMGHPFRKDFPVMGYVEMRYDPELKRVIYQPVTIEPREIVPRVIREEHYGDSGKK